MGSHWFSGCDLVERFSHAQISPRSLMDGQRWVVWDWDQRRSVDVLIPHETEEDFIYEAVSKFIDTIPPDIAQVELDEQGVLVTTSSNPRHNHSWVPFYPLRTAFPPHVATLRRENLTEVDRLGLQVDLVTYSPQSQPGETRQAVFKYYITEASVAPWWHEVNCVMRMPPHPNIVPFDALVVDSVDGADRVVGSTTRYIAGYTLKENDTRIFKLKYLQQLINVVDYLNLQLGIVHGDICPWNLLIDPSTDNIQLFDFGSGAKLGWEGDEENNLEFQYDADRDDVKFIIFTIYELITREFNFRQEFYPEELDASEIMEENDWEQHPDSKLDSPVDEYRHLLAEWVKRRADNNIDHFTKTSQPLEWPPLYVDDPFLNADGTPLKRKGRMREVMVSLGKDFLRWQRPPTSSMPLPQGQRLLANGEVVRDEDVAGTSPAFPARASTGASTGRQTAR